MLSRGLKAGVFDNRDTASSSEADASDSNDQPVPYETLVVPPTGEHSATVIWLHGLGGNNKEIQHYVDEVSDLPGLDHIKFIVPQAPDMPVTGNDNYVMPSWFDCYSFDIENRDEDVDGQKQASDLINDIITQEEKEWGIPPSRVVVGGLSQGSAVALHVALTTQRPLGGAFVLSGYVPQRTQVAEFASPISKTLPYFWAHGKRDKQVKYLFSLDCARTLASDLGVEMVELTTKRNHTHTEEEEEPEGEGEHTRAKMEFFGYPNLVHWMSSEEMDDLGKWLREVVPRRSSGATTSTT